MRIEKRVIDFLNAHKECDDVILSYRGTDSNLSRFGLNRITQNMSKKIDEIKIKAIKDESIGSAVTTRGDRDSLLETLRIAERIATSMPKDPEFIPPSKPKKCATVRRVKTPTMKVTPKMKARKIEKIVESAKKKNATVAGYFSNGRTDLTVLNTKGFFCSHSYTNADFSITVFVDGSSGFAQYADEDIGEVDPFSLYRTACDKAERGRNPIEIEPGDYPVLLEPIALGSFLGYLSYVMDRRSADEGWSFFSKKLGKKIASSSITLYSDPECTQNRSIPFDFEGNGIPLKKHMWIKNGICNKLIVRPYWAKKKGIRSTGAPSNFILKGSQTSREQIMKKVDYGLLITRLWYIRFVNRKELILTGMTRDGLFLIEGGKVTKPLRNMRFNDSPFSLLSSVEVLGKPERVEGRYLVPSIFAKKFHFASTTKF
jgi:predicted Zn-dependent protease